MSLVFNYIYSYQSLSPMLQLALQTDGFETGSWIQGFERLARSIGTFKEDASQDSCRRFKSWNTNSFKFYLDLAVTDYNITEDTHRSLFLKCLDEGIRMRLENAVLPKEITDFNVEQLVEKTQMFYQRKCNAIVERVKLHRRIQREEEAVQEYAKGLKRIATTCSFKAGEYED